MNWRFFIQLRLLNYALSVICIQESGLNEQDYLCNIQLEGKTNSKKQA